ncbi:FtsX-like permease family protein [Winogradskya consettensis]|uniref:ABC transporter permease n=1 Tax=Winogradskya consettensis TaxID=113560 RepID=A0A919SEB7_9ACTN|nr:ABC transporter permease [Actinoplanes consettensis]GIM70822.1 ABC transporter permease [Actinoplanes consettensis]
MSALGRVVRSGVARRRVPTIVTVLVVMVAVTSAVLGASLAVASRGPFERAFQQHHGAHLAARIDAAKATPAQLAGTATAAGVAAVAGPFPLATVSAGSGRFRMPPMEVAGRGTPGSAVDELTLTRGRWATGPGEIVLAVNGRFDGPLLTTGEELTLDDVPGNPVVTVVGFARSITRTADAWAQPGQVTAWQTAQSASQNQNQSETAGRAGYQMLYRLTAAGTQAQVEAGTEAIAAGLPAGALTGATSWLAVRRDVVGDTVLLIPFLIAFGLLGVVMAVLIVGNVIAGAVASATRRIGILKALGFTPGQVVRAYVMQALIPAAAGAVLGLGTGYLSTLPVITKTNDLYGTTDRGTAPWVGVLVVAGILAVVALTAWAAAARAGRLRTVDALAVGRTPRAGRGRWASRLAGRIPLLSRPVSLGLAYPFTRPMRSAGMIAAIAFGAASVTFAVGLATSLSRIDEVEDIAAVQVTAPAERPVTAPAERPEPGAEPPGADPPRAEPPGAQDGPPAISDPAKVAAAINAQPGTSGYLGTARTEVTTPGATGQLTAMGLTGPDASRYYRMVSGRWLRGPGEIVVATPFLTATGKKVGDQVTLTSKGSEGRDIPVRIVGEAFNIDEDGMQILTDQATLGLTPEAYYITVKDGTDIDEYAAALSTALEPLGAVADQVDHDPPEMLVLIDALAALLTVLLVVVAGLGVLNTVVLETRDRVHDLGVHKALGMTPRQTIAMVISSVVLTGLAGGVAGVAVGVLVQRTVLGAMGRGTGFTLPASVVDAYGPGVVLLLAVGGLVIAVTGALLPAGWAARTRTVTALRTE